jgi:glycosyltransferase involved in cell wall biosynthesis
MDKNDDGVLGFIHGWVQEFAKHCERVTVICLYQGDYTLPDNVKVLSLGKEEFGVGNLKSKFLNKFIFVWKFYKYIWQERNNYDSVFVHMNEVYVVLGGIFWRIMGKKIGFWFAHGSVNPKLRMAALLTHIIFTSTPSGFRLKSRKVKVVGQGIDTDKFTPDHSKKDPNYFTIISVGRISPIKDYETLIRAIEFAKDSVPNIRAKIIGGPGTNEQEEYLAGLKKMVEEKKLNDYILFIGPLAYHLIIDHLQSADLYVNASHTGSLDKTIIEAMAVELPILSCNESLVSVLGASRDKSMFIKSDKMDLGEKIKIVHGLSAGERINIGRDLRRIAESDHGQRNLIKKIKLIYEQ